jgi:hypothetical protein
MKVKLIRKNSILHSFWLAGMAMGFSIQSEAVVVYNFQSSPIIVETEQDGNNYQVNTNNGSGFPLLPPIGSVLSASLSFANPLAANASITLSAESGGFDIYANNGASQGGVLAFTAPALFPYSITSDINAYKTGESPDSIAYNRYASLGGSIQTDGTGNISTWDLSFTLLDFSGDPLIFDKNTNTFNSPSASTDAAFDISSNPAQPVTISNVVALNGVANTNNYNFNGADVGFADPGNVQNRYWTGAPGSWQAVNPIPAPNILFIALAALVCRALFCPLAIKKT